MFDKSGNTLKEPCVGQCHSVPGDGCVHTCQRVSEKTQMLPGQILMKVKKKKKQVRNKPETHNLKSFSASELKCFCQ